MGLKPRKIKPHVFHPFRKGMRFDLLLMTERSVVGRKPGKVSFECSEKTLDRKEGTGGSNLVSSSEESANYRFRCAGIDSSARAR
jgi:hypothetical protein